MNTPLATRAIVRKVRVEGVSMLKRQPVAYTRIGIMA
jgi:hypothetical protein